MIPNGYEPIKLSSGDDHTAILFKDSQSNDTILLLMGSNHFGQLGRMPTDDADDSYYNLIGQFEYESDNWLPIGLHGKLVPSQVSILYGYFEVP